MLGEPPDLPARRVLELVRAHWDGQVTSAEQVPTEDGAFHWAVGDDSGPRWAVTADPLDGSRRRSRLLSAYAAAARLASRLDAVLAPVAARSGAPAVDASPGYLVSVAPWADEVAAPRSDVRPEAAALLARLHAVRAPQALPAWTPRIGVRRSTERERLLALLHEPVWRAGPCGEPARRVLHEHRDLLDESVRRLDLLAAAVTGAAGTWVPTHGAPTGTRLVRTEEGLRLRGWGHLALAPAERDLWHVLGGRRGEPESDPDAELAYLAAGGSSWVSADALELFELDWCLGEVADHGVRLAGAHSGSADDSRCLSALADELAALRDLSDRRR